MHCLQWGLLVAVGAFSLTSCSFFSRSGKTAIVSDTAAELPALVEATPAPDAVFADGVAEAPQAITTVVPDLIRSTDPDERARQVQRSRPDPFASLAITPSLPIVLPSGEDDAIAERPSLPNARSSSSSPSAGSSRPSPSTGSSRPNPSTRSSRPNPSTRSSQPSPSAGNSRLTPSPSRTAAVRPGTAEPTAKPPVPQLTVARTVSVSGVIQVDGVAYAIVRVPNQPERYVRQGDRIANNQVLVKQINVQTAEPKVVLEENGVELAMGVSEAVVASTDPSEDNSASPLPVPVLPLPVLPDIPPLPLLNSP